ncbi:hypothetical protein V6N13_086354 [Hibiscus sabdariffa]
MTSNNKVPKESFGIMTHSRFNLCKRSRRGGTDMDRTLHEASKMLHFGINYSLLHLFRKALGLFLQLHRSDRAWARNGNLEQASLPSEMPVGDTLNVFAKQFYK